MLSPSDNLRALARPHFEQVITLLDRHPARNILLRSWAEQYQLEPPGAATTRGWFVDDELRGVFVHSPIVMMCCDDPLGLTTFGRLVGRSWPITPIAQVMCPRTMATPFFTAIAEQLGSLPPMRSLRARMIGMQLTAGALPPWEEIAARIGTTKSWASPRVAQEKDLAAIEEAYHAVLPSDLDLKNSERADLRRVALSNIQGAREYLLEEDGQFSFRIAVGTATPESILLEGAYTAPAYRDRGHATWGMHAMCNQLFAEYKRVVIFVEEDNDALRIWGRLGFTAFEEFTSAIF